MRFASFLKQSLIILASILLASYMIDWSLGSDKLVKVFAAASVLFVVFNTGIFLYADKVSRTTNLYSFNNVIVTSFMIKLIMSIVFLYLWDRIYQPPTGHHVMYYVLTYIIFTVHEVYFLTLLARNHPASRGN